MVDTNLYQIIPILLRPKAKEMREFGNGIEEMDFGYKKPFGVPATNLFTLKLFLLVGYGRMRFLHKKEKRNTKKQR